MAAFTLVEDFSTDDTTVAIEGRTFPAPCLVQDPDGFRLLLLPPDTTTIAVRLWEQAHAGGAVALVAVESDDHPIFLVQLAEQFIATRTEYGTTFGITDWQGLVGESPTYRTLITPGMLLGGTPDAPQPTNTFVHVHCHSEFSSLDGLSGIKEIVQAVKADGNTAVAVTDHGNCSAHPDLQLACDDAGIQPIFGMEAYFVPDRHRRGKSWVNEDGTKGSDSKEALGEYTHICLWAATQQGLRNLWAMSTESHAEGFYGKPRLDWDTLTRLNDGVLASTGCLRGPVPQALLAGDTEGARLLLGRMLGIFGDRLYAEIHTNHLPDQQQVNVALVALARQMGVPLVAAVDSHYTCPEDAPTHRAWLAIQTNKDLADDSSLFAGGQAYHLHTESEVRQALAYLGQDVVDEACANTVALAARCQAEVRGATTPPIFTRPSADCPTPADRQARDVDRLIDLCLSNWHKTEGKTHDAATYTARFQREMDLLIAKDFAGYFLLVADYVNHARSERVLVGPGRGSGGGSLVAFLAGIIGIDPVDTGLLFERFLSEGRDGLPDFDIDFPTWFREPLKNYLRDRWGSDHVVTIGTTTRLQSKGALNDAARVLAPTLPYEVAFTDMAALKALVDAADAPLAGKHLPWEQFCTQFSETVAPLRRKYPHVFDMTDRIVGKVRTFGKHPAGVVISTDTPLTDLPLRQGEDGQMITQFDMNALERLGYVKCDLLTLRTLDTIELTVRAIREKFGIEIDFDAWGAQEYGDPQVWEELSAGQTLGVFQVETHSGTELIKRYQPRSMQDLANVITLVRPGPKRSGLTETFLRRREGLEPVTVQEPRMAAVLIDTFGCMVYQEDIMNICMALAGYNGSEADAVRSILGKKKVEKVAKAGAQFLDRAVANGVDKAVAQSIWDQMAFFALYSFNKSHAWGYAVLGVWTAWLKVHFPVQFLTAALSTVDTDRIPEFIGDARRMGYVIQPPDINTSGLHFTPQQTSVRFGLASIKGIGEQTARHILAGQPYASLEDFTARCITPTGSKVNRGDLALLVGVGAFDSLVPNRRAVEQQLAAEQSGAASTCTFMDLSVLGPGGLPCTYDWASEPDPPLVSRGRGKDKVTEPKPPPKRCTVACRQYRKPAPVDVALTAPYTPQEIRDREKELLGVWLTSTPFDDIPLYAQALVQTADDVAAGPCGKYTVAAIVEAVKVKTDRAGKTYAFVTLNAQTGTFDAMAFSDIFRKYRPDLRLDALVYADVVKDDRGIKLLEVAPVA